MNSNNIRLKRLNSLLRTEISDIIHKEIKDPRIGFVSVTEVELSNDLRVAKVYLSFMENEKVKKINIKILQSIAPFIKSRIKEDLDLKYIPEIKFLIDNSIERGERISSILDKLKKSGELE